MGFAAVSDCGISWSYSLSDQDHVMLAKMFFIGESHLVCIVNLKRSSRGGLALTLFYCWNINPFMPNVFSHPYQLDESISNLRVVGWYFSFLFKFSKNFL